SLICLPEGSEAMACIACSRPSAISTRVPLALSWTPAPSSRNSAACSKISTSRPRCSSASPATSPAMPAPAIRALGFGCAFMQWLVLHPRDRRADGAGIALRPAAAVDLHQEGADDAVVFVRLLQIDGMASIRHH